MNIEIYKCWTAKIENNKKKVKEQTTQRDIATPMLSRRWSFVGAISIFNSNKKHRICRRSHSQGFAVDGQRHERSTKFSRRAVHGAFLSTVN